MKCNSIDICVVKLMKVLQFIIFLLWSNSRSKKEVYSPFRIEAHLWAHCRSLSWQNIRLQLSTILKSRRWQFSMHDRAKTKHWRAHLGGFCFLVPSSPITGRFEVSTIEVCTPYSAFDTAWSIVNWNINSRDRKSTIDWRNILTTKDCLIYLSFSNNIMYKNKCCK